jgi:hypothetical protein
MSPSFGLRAVCLVTIDDVLRSWEVFLADARPDACCSEPLQRNLLVALTGESRLECRMYATRRASSGPRMQTRGRAVARRTAFLPPARLREGAFLGCRTRPILSREMRRRRLFCLGAAAGSCRSATSWLVVKGGREWRGALWRLRLLWTSCSCLRSRSDSANTRSHDPMCCCAWRSVRLRGAAVDSLPRVQRVRSWIRLREEETVDRLCVLLFFAHCDLRSLLVAEHKESLSRLQARVWENECRGCCCGQGGAHHVV